MNTVALADWVEDIMIRLPGTTKRVVEHQLFATAQEFFRDSHAWTARIPFIVDDTKKYLYLSPTYDGANVNTVLRCAYDGKFMPPSGALPIRDLSPAIPQSFYMVDSGTLQLLPSPSLAANGKDVLVDVSLIPENFDTPIPSDIWVHHRKALICGTLGNLYDWAGRPWYKPKQAILEQRKFKFETIKAKKKTLARFTQGNYSWRYPTWA